MTTYDELVEEILSTMQGYALAPDQVTHLTQALTASDLTVYASPQVTGSGVDPGFGTSTIEIGDELIFIQSADNDLATLTALPKGRGWRGTTAAAHAVGDTIVIDPLVPRHRVKRAITDTLDSAWPVLFAPAASEFTVSGVATAWEIPAEAEQVLDVRWQDTLGNWERVRHWEVEHSSPGATGSMLRVGGVPIGRTVRTVYGKRLGGFASGSAALADTGLSASGKDVVIWGALARLVPALDAGRLGVQYVPADELDQPRQFGSAMALAREFKANHQLALLKEQQHLQNRYPARQHFTR